MFINICWGNKFNQIYLQNNKNQLNFTFTLHTTITKSGLTAIINTTGAELVSLKNEFGKEYIWEGNPTYWGKHSPVLFPIVGTLKNNEYHYNGLPYSLPRHGFARDMDFEIVHQREDEVVFSISKNAATYKVYPFDFELQIRYAIEHNRLAIGYRVFNKNDFKMPFSIGAHPAFALPGDFEDYSIEMEQDEKLIYHLLENDLISDNTATLQLIDKKFALNYGLFENDALVFKTLKSQSLQILQNGNPLLKIQFKGFPNLGIWTKENAPFICIEPWFGFADSAMATGDILEKEGIQLLDIGTEFNATFTIETL